MSVVVSISMPSDLSEWTSTVTDSGDLAWAAGAGLAGTSGGMQAVIDDTNAIYATKSGLSNTSGKFRIRFYLDPNSLGGSDTNFQMFFMRSSAPLALVQLDLLHIGSTYYLNAWFVTDPSYETTGSFEISDAPHYVEIYYARAATAVSSDGIGQIWVDGVSKGAFTNLDNYDDFANFNSIDLGPYAGIEAGTSGTLYFDEVVVNDDGSEIGPATVQLAIQDATNAHTAENLALTQHNILAIQDATDAHEADNIALTQHNILETADASHDHIADNVTLTAHDPSTQLVIQDAAHDHIADNVTLTQHNILSVFDATNGHTAENVTLTAHDPSSITLVIQDASHTHVTESLDLIQHHVLTIADATHVHTADQVNLIVLGVLEIADATHVHQSDNVAPLVSYYPPILNIHDASHKHTADGPSQPDPILRHGVPGGFYRARWVGPVSKSYKKKRATRRRKEESK